MNKRGRLSARSKYVDVMNPSGNVGGASSQAPPPGPTPPAMLTSSTVPSFFVPQQPPPSGEAHNPPPIHIRHSYTTCMYIHDIFVDGSEMVAESLSSGDSGTPAVAQPAAGEPASSHTQHSIGNQPPSHQPPSHQPPSQGRVDIHVHVYSIIMYTYMYI